MLELVAGLIDKSEQPEEVARREAEEEADCVVTALEPIARYFSSPGGNSEFFHLYCGRADLSTAGGVFGLENEGEDIKVHVFDLEQCWSLLDRGEIINAHTMIALQWLKLNRADVDKKWL